MTPEEIYLHFGSGYSFHEKTGMSAVNLLNWQRKGFVPEGSQYKIQRLTNGELVADPLCARKDDKHQMLVNDILRALDKCLAKIKEKHGVSDAVFSAIKLGLSKTIQETKKQQKEILNKL